MMQHVMKVNGKVEDQSMVYHLTLKKHMSRAIQKEMDAFLTSVTDYWGRKSTNKDLGADINLVPDPTTMTHGRLRHALVP